MRTFYELIIAGYLLTPIFLGLILIPWLKGKTDLFSVWTLFMLGSINFISLGLVQNGRAITSDSYDGLALQFVVATFVFYTILSVVYLWPRKKPLRPVPSWLKWPNDSASGLTIAALSLSVFSLTMAILIPSFQGAQLLYVTRTPMSIAAFATAMYLLWRRPKLPHNWLIAGFCFAVGVTVVLTWGTGRRALVALLAAVPAIAYWARFRYQHRGKTLFWLSALALGGLVVVTSYQTFRHEGRKIESTKERVVSRIQNFPTAIADTVTNWNWMGSGGAAAFDTQNAIDAGLRTMLALENETLERSWLATPVFIVTNPIPRSVWPDKPKGLGKILPLAYGNPRITWGPSVIGHSFYDGGWVMVFVYPVLLGLVIRFIDGQLAADPDNPWLKVILVSIAGHALGFPRGDCGTFGVQILGMFVILPALLMLLRPIVGTRQNRLPVAQVDISMQPAPQAFVPSRVL